MPAKKWIVCTAVHTRFQGKNANRTNRNMKMTEIYVNRSCHPALATHSVLLFLANSNGKRSFPYPYNPEYVRGMSFEFMRGLRGGGGRVGDDGDGTIAAFIIL
mmetsp:Transcript_23615/g.40070  ORF Transcript_23615/g.40070 Transcript_23615/m.40070 type:complete len:103 (-) Transcript_23615:107-415(-)